VPFTFLGIITFPVGNPGGTLTYFWSRSTEGGGDQPLHSIAIQPGQTELKVTDTWNVSAEWGDGRLLYDKLFTQTPNIVISNAVNISLMCAFYVTSIAGSASPTAWCPPGRINTFKTVTFSYTINVNPSPGGTVYFQIKRTDPAGNTSTSNSSQLVAGGAPSVTVSDYWTIYSFNPAGSYTEVLTITSPMSQWGPVTVTFTKTC
jgi:hypothetical protein